MSKHYQSSAAQCPFYVGEESRYIFCEGIAPDITLRLSFGRKAAEYRDTFCCGEWKECLIAKALWQKYGDVSEMRVFSKALTRFHGEQA